MNKIPIKFAMVAGIVLVAALSRILPHPLNFSPLVAISLFGGAMFQQTWKAFVIPIAAYFVSDLLFMALGQPGFYGPSQYFVYASMLLVVALGTTLKNPKALRIAGYSLGGSAIFWILSNFGVWAANYFAAGTTIYEPNLTLGFTYLRALPFYNTFASQLFVGTFVGDLFYCGLLFGAFALAQKYIPALHHAPAQEA